MPTLYSRQDMVDYALRSLGAPTIAINVTDEQLDDRVDEALKRFWEFHGDGNLYDLVKYTITPQDITNQYLTIDDENIWTVLRIQPLGNTISSTNNLQYYMYISDLISNVYAGKGGIGDFLESERYLNEINFLFNHEKRIRFNKHTRVLNIDTDWSKIPAGLTIMLEVYRIIDDVNYPDIFNNTWLQKYVIALIARQWGSNISKYDGFQLPSGITLNGSKILDDAKADIDKLEQELQATWMNTTSFMMG